MPADVYDTEHPEYGNTPAFDDWLADGPTDEAEIHPKPAKPEELPSKPEEFLSKPEEFAPYQAGQYEDDGHAGDVPEATDPGPVGFGAIAQPGDTLDDRVLDAPQLDKGSLEFATSVEPDPKSTAEPTPREESLLDVFKAFVVKAEAKEKATKKKGG